MDDEEKQVVQEIRSGLEEVEADKILELKKIDDLIEIIKNYDEDWFEQIINEDVLENEFEYEELQGFLTASEIELEERPPDFNQLTPLVFLAKVEVLYTPQEEDFLALKDFVYLEELTFMEFPVSRLDFLVGFSDLNKLKFQLVMDSDERKNELLYKERIENIFPNHEVDFVSWQLDLFGGITTIVNVEK